MNHGAIAAVLGTLLPITTWAQATWVNDQTVQQQLAAGQIAVRIVFDGDGSRTRIDAAVRVNASPETVWRVLTDCEHAASYIPGVKQCRRLQTARDGSWEILEQEAKYSWLMPPVTCVVRADYKRPYRIDFKRVSGDLKEEEGDWVLSTSISDPVPMPAGRARPVSASEQAPHETTIVEYELYVDPGFWIPRVLARHSVRTELPAALAAIRARAESDAGTHE